LQYGRICALACGGVDAERVAICWSATRWTVLPIYAVDATCCGEQATIGSDWYWPTIPNFALPAAGLVIDGCRGSGPGPPVGVDQAADGLSVRDRADR
jgi:hypothetical protein